MTKLPYSSKTSLIAAFRSGQKFEMVNSAGSRFPVKAVRPTVGKNLISVLTELNAVYHSISLDGSTVIPGLRLEHAMTKSVAAPSAPVVARPSLIERFIVGTEFYSAHTREVVVAVAYKRGHNLMEVTLRDEAGKERTTPRYNKDGTHKHRAERSLIAGKLPPKKREVKVTIYKHAFNGSLFVIREGEVLPDIRGINNASVVGQSTITE